MALKEPYCDIACADQFLAGSDTWNNATAEQKNAALFWGTMYIDAYYNCPYLKADPDNPSSNIQYANSLLAEDYLQGNLLNSDGSKEPSLRAERVKAGSVEVESEYSPQYTENPQQDVDALLNSECTKRGQNFSLLTRN